jgi:large repetitive protein
MRKKLCILLLSCDADVEFEPAWTSAPALPIATFEGYATATRDRIFYIGGIVGFGTDPNMADPTRAVWSIDSDSGAWTKEPQLPKDAAKHHLAVAVVDNEIYVLGGFDGILGRVNDGFRPIAKTYVLREGAWRALASAPLARGGATAQAIDGLIYVVGGAPTEDEPPYAELEAFDPRTNTWTRLAPLSAAREHLASCVVHGKLLVIGGWDRRTSTTRSELYDPKSNQWTSTASLPFVRGGLAATSLQNQCHVIGGEDWNLPYPGTFNQHLVYEEREWHLEASMPESKHGLGFATLGRELWAIGGGPGQGNSYSARVDRFLPRK